MFLLEEKFTKYLEKNASKLMPVLLGSIDESKHVDINKYLYKPLLDYSNNAGKLHRPLTCIATYKACGGNDDERISKIACAIEHFQTAALIHDDIADGASIRRSKPCLHKVEGDAVALNIGDYALSMVLGSIIDEEPIILKEILHMEYMTIEGQAMDLGWARDKRYDISEEDYFVMATKKTAYYSVAQPCVLGAISANHKSVEDFRNFGIKLGLAFQLKDDLLNIVGNSNDKDFRSDIDEGKRTLILIKTIEELGCDILDKDRDEIADAMIKTGALEYVDNKAKDLALEAKDILEHISNLNDWKKILFSMCDWVTERKL